MIVRRYYTDRLVGLLSLFIATAVLLVAAGASGRGALGLAAAQNDDLTRLNDRLALQLETAKAAGTNDAILSSDFIWPGSVRADLERQLQDKTLAVAKAANLALTSFGPATGPNDLSSGTIAYALEGSASWTDLLKFTNDLNAVRPPLAIGEISLRTGPLNASEPAPRIGFRVTLWGLAPELAEAAQ